MKVGLVVVTACEGVQGKEQGNYGLQSEKRQSSGNLNKYSDNFYLVRHF